MNKPEAETDNMNEKKVWIRNYSLSILFHLILIFGFIYFFKFQSDKSKINAGFFTVDTQEYLQTKDDNVKSEIEESAEEQKNITEEKTTDHVEKIKSLSFSDIIADTTNLDQVYSESTLNVSIKYPKGWTFIDQNKKKKLDGVTFWSNDENYYPPPYIHLEVIDKDMFIEKRYSYKMELENYKAYYNDPEEMQGYITQIIYIRTDDEEDFRLKLMMKGEKEFNAFHPKFWAILKSFNFGSSLF